MKKPLLSVTGGLVFLAVISAAVFLRPPSLQSSARRIWKQQSLAEIAARIADPAWPTNELARLKPPSANEASDDSSWMSDRIIVTRKGEWLAYANVCQKQERHIPDLFLARGSDGQWYYSTYHFCIGMLVLRMEEQPEDLAGFARTYFLRTFDGQSDVCLGKTFPPGAR